MKRFFRFSMLMLACFLGVNSFAQIEIRQPFMIDSTNNKGEKFNYNSVLQIPPVEQLKKKNIFKSVVENEVVNIEVSSGNSYKINTYICYIIANSFSKTTLNLFSTDMVKVGLDGKNIKERLSYKDSLNDESKISVELNLEPGKYILSFSFLSSDENKNHQFKFNIEGDSILIGNGDGMDFKYGLTLESMLGGRNIYNTSISPRGELVLVKFFDTDNMGKKHFGYYVGNRASPYFYDYGNASIEWLEDEALFQINRDELYYFDKVNDNRRLVKQISSGGKFVIAENLPEGDITILPKKEYGILSQNSNVDLSNEDLRRYLIPDDRIGGWRNRTLLSLYNFKTSQIQPLTFGYHSTYLNDYNPKTNSILFSVSYDNITKRPFSENAIYEMNLDSFKVDTIVDRDGFVSNAKYIPNSDYVVVKASGEAFGGVGNTLKKGVIPNPYHSMLFLLNVKTKAVECITKDFNPSISSFKVTENNKIYFNAENKDYVWLYVYSLDTKTIEKIECNLDIVSGFDVTKDGNAITYFGQNYNDFPIVYLKDTVGTHKVIKAKEKNDLALGEMKAWNFDYKNTTIEGRYYLPYDFDSTKKYPMIVYYYGGTSPTDRSFEMRYSAYLYTAQGYIFYVLNPSGTTGWGQEFAARHVNAWGEKTADEIIFGVKKLCKENSFIDATKIGCMGASYGGFMTQLLQTKTDIFACAISHAGISDITSYWGEGYWGYSYSSGATAHSYPWNRKDIYVDRSPLFNANKINTPLLLLHGDSDTNVPIGESIQMYNALKILGKEVEFISVKGENHGIVDYQKRLKWNNTIYAWFAKHLKGQDSWWKALYPEAKL
ncbi:MAG: prolyl oligopeptidase family serine peptidase [Bacteroidales bacterium]